VGNTVLNGEFNKFQETRDIPIHGTVDQAIASF
jgi:hypothetical protein